jgi:hypothetical protein
LDIALPRGRWWMGGSVSGQFFPPLPQAGEGSQQRLATNEVLAQRTLNTKEFAK